MAHFGRHSERGEARRNEGHRHIRRSYVECERPESQIDWLVLILAINAKVPQDEQIHFRTQKTVERLEAIS